MDRCRKNGASYFNMSRDQQTALASTGSIALGTVFSMAFTLTGLSEVPSAESEHSEKANAVN